jgi:DNA-directed RNA polymerase specialized sigma24 family protein
MAKRTLNEVQADYQHDPAAYETELFSAIYRRAGRVLRDPDAAQELTIRTWQAIKADRVKHLSAWLRQNFRWMLADMNRHLATNRLHAIADLPAFTDDEGEEMSHDDQLDAIAERSYRSQNEDRPARVYSRLTAEQRQIVGLLETGHSVAEIAELLDFHRSVIYDKIHSMQPDKMAA